ncbi:auxin-responsive protein IAA12-like [Henckelia pumila]|uniref:auxin-responsive protein IAA12-like n=1 Tax=Henckelia pumila TaxID=405737 RepID=UPI003C6E8761
MSTMSMEVVSSEESSSYPDESAESELELDLGLSIGGGKDKIKPPHTAAEVGSSRDRYARILTPKDFLLLGSTKDSSSSSSASVTKAKNNGSCGTKRTAEPSSLPGRSAVSQAVGWPPIPTHRMNNHLKSPAAEELTSTLDRCSSKNNVVDKTREYQKVATENGHVKASLFVKVNIDGFPIGRKVDLNAHSCYETLAYTLDDMFRPGVTDGAKRSNMEEQVGMPTRLLGGVSDFVLTYEDKDGDWMLVGDVPWEMFLSAVRRLRIMKTDEAKGLAPRSRDRFGRQTKIYSKNLERRETKHL